MMWMYIAILSYPNFFRGEWNSDAPVWVTSSSDVPCLVTEAEIIEALETKRQIIVPKLLEMSVWHANR